MSDKILVLVNLNGGNDSLNTIIPLNAYGDYSKIRKDIAIPESRVVPFKDIGLHPSLRKMGYLFQDGGLAIIQNVGMPQPDFSHFRAQDIWHTASHSNQYLQSGWIGRACELSFPSGIHPSAIKIGTVPSLAMTGERATHGITVASESSFYDFIDGTEPIPPGYGGKRLAMIREIRRSTEAYSAEIKKAAASAGNHYPYPDDSFAAQLKIVARLIAGGMQTKVYMVSMNGFDTHADQVNTGDTTTGAHADLLFRLSEAINAFMMDLSFLGISDKVVGMTYSEFGRTIKPNGSRGTDHGSAGHQFVFGKNINAGIFGSVTAEHLTGQFLPMQFDFRDLYANALRWLGTDDKSVLFGDFFRTSIIRQPEPPVPVRKERYRFIDADANKKITLFTDKTWEEGPIQ